MKRDGSILVAAVITVFGVMPAIGQDSPVVAACEAVARHLTMDQRASVEAKQDFSALSPPHARIALRGVSLVGVAPVECTFDTSAPPMSLTGVCYMGVCLPLPETVDQQYRASFETIVPLSIDELNLLLDQDGF